MKHHKYIIIVALLVLGQTTISYGQTTRLNTSNTNAWFMYFGNHKLSERIGIHVEAQLRRSDFVAQDQQILLRGGLDYYTKSNNRLTAGYAFVKTFPYGEFAVSKAFPEHRIWQQFQTVQSIGKLKLAHRYRLEQRIIGNSSTGKLSGGRYENRMRYMAKMTFNLTKGTHPVYGAIYDEIFLNFGREVGYNIFDQNRLYAALGFTLSKNVKLEAGYLYQLIQLRSLDAGPPVKNKIENNSTFQIGVFSAIPFYNQAN